MLLFKTHLITLWIVMFSTTCFSQGVEIKAEILLKIDAVIKKIINETQFDFSMKEQKASEDIQSINFKNQFGLNNYKSFAYAFSYINCKEEGIYQFGYSSAGKSEIWINNEKVHSSYKITEFNFVEFGYDMYRFPESFKAFCKKGINQILIKIESEVEWKFYLAAIQENGLINNQINFTIEPQFKKTSSNWLLCGPFNPETDIDILPENKILPFYKTSKIFINWILPNNPIILKVNPADNATFKKHSYNEWHYSTGATLWSILNYANEMQIKEYEDFVKKCSDFTIDNFDLFKHQYYDLNEIHGFNHRIYRLNMLDDASAPALPYLRLFNQGKLLKGDSILKKVENYIFTGQSRLADNTFCRPEPWPQTIWADDLFMCTPFLMMRGRQTGNSKYYDEAAFQVISYYKYLINNKINICRHGWIDSQQKDSIPYWGRANGWMIWAISEVLLNLPENHKNYKAIKKLYKKHIDGLIAFQNRDGFLHQLLNEPNSFVETSSTAMFTIAMARGLNQGWLPKGYRKYAIIGWNAIKSQIDANGTVKGICEGTSINTNQKYYMERKRPDHDPRGLGAVITAGLEIYKMLN